MSRTFTSVTLRGVATFRGLNGFVVGVEIVILVWFFFFIYSNSTKVISCVLRLHIVGFI